MRVWFRQLRSVAALAVLELYRRKDLIVVFLLSAVILFPLAFFAPFGVSGAGRYICELALLLIWLFSGVIGFGVSARLFPPEFESRTIYPMLSKPVGRGTILLGKYLGGLAASVSALAAFYLAYGVMAGLREGVWFSEILIQAFVMHVGFLVLVTALGLSGSLLLTPSANLTLGGLVVVVMLLFGQRLPSFAAGQPQPVRALVWLAHAVGPHVEFFDLRQRVVHAWPTVGWGVCAAALAYAVAYAAACLAVAAAVFRRRRF